MWRKPKPDIRVHEKGTSCGIECHFIFSSPLLPSYHQTRKQVEQREWASFLQAVCDEAVKRIDSKLDMSLIFIAVHLYMLGICFHVKFIVENTNSRF